MPGQGLLTALRQRRCTKATRKAPWTPPGARFVSCSKFGAARLAKQATACWRGKRQLTFGVEASAAGAAGHLQQLVVGEHGDAAVAAPGQRAEHRGARRHVDARRQGLRGKHRLQHPCMQTPALGGKGVRCERPCPLWCMCWR